MKTFAEIQGEFSGNTVTALDDRELTGFIRLAGPDTVLTLSGDHPYHQSRDQNGWFDVTVEATNGQFILLHKSIETSMRTHGRNKAETQIFPNVVVVGNSQKLDLVKSIAFQARGLRYFFHYEHIERQTLWHSSSDVLKAIKSLRRSNEEWMSEKFGSTGRDYDFFRPTAIYLSHSVPRAFKFRLGERFYEIGFGGFSKGAGWGGIQIQIEPVAQISFDTPIDIDAALDAIWEWQFFFEQIAMEEMSVKAISTRTGRRYQSSAEVYLPFAENSDHEPNHMFGLHPARIPYNRWDQRHKLAAAMKLWLEKHEERKQFRAHLGRVIREIGRGHDIDQIVRLCSAVESMAEIKPRSSVSRAQVQQMSAAAAALAEENGWEIPATSIQNAMSVLRRPSLPARLKQLSQMLAPLLKNDDCNLVIGLAHKLRNIAAHGKSHDDYQNPIVRPTVDALTAMCTLFDLHSCGFHQSKDHTSLNCLGRWTYAVADIKQLQPA